VSGREGMEGGSPEDKGLEASRLARSCWVVLVWMSLYSHTLVLGRPFLYVEKDHFYTSAAVAHSREEE